MARREVQSFNLSFLDLLSGALGAVIFLFIIVPKGKNSFPVQSKIEATAVLDTQTMRFIGRPALGSSIRVGDTVLLVLNGSYKDTGDSLMAKIKSYNDWPPYYPPPRENPVTAPAVAAPAPVLTPVVTPATAPAITSTTPVPSDVKSYKGPKPFGPCKLAFELSWADDKDNVDIRVVRDGNKVEGAKAFREHPKIGQWDPGVSKTKVFKKTDFRTNVESVRQLREIIPGEYKIYAVFKESSKGSTSININLLLYTKNVGGVERGQVFNIPLQLGKPGNFTFLGSAGISSDGLINFSR